jgi:hypothetical protein
MFDWLRRYGAPGLAIVVDAEILSRLRGKQAHSEARKRMWDALQKGEDGHRARHWRLVARELARRTRQRIIPPQR